MKNWCWRTIQLIMKKKKKAALLITNGIGCLISASGYFANPSCFFKPSSSKHRITGQFKISNLKDGSPLQEKYAQELLVFFFLAMQCVVSWFLTRDQAHAPYFGNSECFFIFLNLFLIALGLVAAHRLSLVVESGGYSVVSLVVEPRL